MTMPFPHRRFFTSLAWCFGVLAVSARDASAQECPGGRISNIFVDSHSIFDMSQIEEDTRFRWIYGFANSLHARTRASFLKAELLVQVGDCVDQFLLEESERILRQYDFLARVDVYAVPQPDGSQHIVVDTQDEWTTELSLRFRFDTGVNFVGIDLTEENFLGRGILLGGFWRNRRELRDVGWRFGTPRTFGTRLNSELLVGDTRVGSFFDQRFTYPFVGEVGHWATREVYSRRETLFSYALEDHPTLSHVVLPLETRRAEVTLAGRVGPPGSLMLFGIGISREELRFPDVANRVEAVTNNNFGDRTPAAPEIAAEALRLTRETKTTRLNFLLGKRNIRFRRETGLDALRGVQDIPVGTEVALTVGKSIGFLDSNGPAEVDDIFTRLRLFGGVAPGRWILTAGVSVEGRHFADKKPAARTGWRDVLGEADAYVYWRPKGTAGTHTVFARLSAAGGWNMDTPLQLTLGGPEQLRGLHLDRFPGGRRLVATVEDRIVLGWTGGGLLDFGMTVFGDLGQTWKGDVPFGMDSGWQSTVGAGIRIGFPKGTRSVARIDIAVPANGPDAFRRPVLRLTALEFLGFVIGFADGQMQRSRRTGVASTILPGPAGG
ncbi:MAG: hypothetical protein BMS9Abin29_2146 [Gemmatimonadota bacterium]|nr:MAG: hypothetical protein BMS9Abin29_2146 [Gemmatimonadota bacterium]